VKNRTIYAIFTSVMAVLLAGAMGIAIWLYTSNSPKVGNFRRNLRMNLKSYLMTELENEDSGLGNVTHTDVFVDGQVLNGGEIDESLDVKKLLYAGETVRLIDYPKGYYADLPSDTEFDFSKSHVFNECESDCLNVTISREYSPYSEVDEYIEYYFNRFILSQEYREANRITLLENESDGERTVIKVFIRDMPEEVFDEYTFVTIHAYDRIFYRVLFKSRHGDERAERAIDEFLSSFKYFKPHGESSANVDYYPVLPDTWSDETRELYDEICRFDELRWGIFTQNVYTDGIDKTIPEMEEKIGYTFPVVLSYFHLNEEFPVSFLERNREDGRIVQLTLQITTSNNLELFGHTPNLDLYRGELDERIREFAQAAREFGHPFLFRLNNEMNSDWTSYSGVINLSDPDIYVENWRRIYDIFEEEGVDNAIWIFNPNDNNYPPCDWNDFLAYYPGNEYVHMIGLTGYNTGTYYSQEMGEIWREFDEIYGEIEEKYTPFFDGFPWIITEFASSSVGGDKVRWIDNMFSSIDKYENIKIAVWFSYADYDYRYRGNQIVARPYWLDETDATLEAFKKGVNAAGA
jgi:mannan endo-1,4-beta-mannosidase